MQHPIMLGTAVSAVMGAAILVANAALDRWSNETLDGVPRCYRCGRAVWEAFITNDGDVYCHDCGRGMPSEWWVEE